MALNGRPFHGCLLCLVFAVVGCSGGVDGAARKPGRHGTQRTLLDAAELHRAGDTARARAMYQEVLAQQPQQPDALHLLGLLAHAEGDAAAAEALIRRALAIKPARAHFHNNLGEVLRASGDRDAAARCYGEATRLAPTDVGPPYNTALMYAEAGRHGDAVAMLQRVLDLDPTHLGALRSAAQSLGRTGRTDDAAALLRRVLELEKQGQGRELGHGQVNTRGAPARAPQGTRIDLGALMQQAGRLSEATHEYNAVLAAEPSHHVALLNMGAVEQERGDLEGAIAYYTRALQSAPDDDRAHNNLGATWQLLGQHETSVFHLRRALELRPSCVEAMINLGVHHQERGEVDQAMSLYSRAYALNRMDGLRIRNATLVRPVYESREQMLAERRRFDAGIDALLRADPPLRLENPVQEVERLHFYLVYHGMNERSFQAKMAQLYARSCPRLVHAAPHLLGGASPRQLSQLKQLQQAGDTAAAAAFEPRPDGRIHVGFISKFFTDNQPHGLLLQGVIRHLPRSRFFVTVLYIPSPLRDVTDYLRQAADRVVTLPLNLFTARDIVGRAALDVLVFADAMSEPMTYFLAFSRLAPVQALFWGNPVTSGNPSMDYFVSGEYMEPTETEHDPHYVEQEVLLAGQAIWYDQLKLPQGEQPPREAWGLRPEWTVFICPQSVFKLHPDFDDAVGAVLARVPDAHVVFIQGRQQAWTDTIRRRMRRAFGEGGFSRTHFLPRVAGSEKFLQLVSTADVMLHPFPFGGSKTSSDGLAMGVPVVAMRGHFLRGRMAYSFYRAMGITECVARDVREYVDIAVRLGRDRAYREDLGRRLKHASRRIWEDMEVATEWGHFLRTAHNSARFAAGGAAQDLPLDLASTAASSVAVDGGAPRGGDSAAAAAASTGAAAIHPPPSDPARAALSDEQFNALLLRAHAQNRAGDVVGAEHSLRKAMAERRPESAAALHNDLGAILQMQHRLQESADEFHAALQLRPDYVEAINNLGVVLQELKRDHEAARMYRRALLLRPTYSGALYNLGDLLKDSGNYSAVVETLGGVMLLPPLGRGLEKLVCLALLELRPEHAAAMGRLETQLVAEDALELRRTDEGGPGSSDRVTLLAEVLRLQEHYASSMNVLAVALGEAGLLSDKHLGVFRRLRRLVDTSAPSSSPPPPPPPPPRPQPTLNLVVQYYAAHSVERQVEIDQCLMQNLRNPLVSKVHVLTEEAFDLHYFREFSESLWGYSKLFQVVLGRRLTFQAAFEYASRNLRGELVALANADIYFDQSLSRLADARLDFANHVLALLRWDVLPDASLQWRPRMDSQDAWIFRSPLPQLECDFPLGLLQADNRIVQVMIDAGMRVSNPSLAIKAHHLQLSQQRDYTEQDTVTGKLKLLPISDELMPVYPAARK